MIGIIRERYADFGPTLAGEKLTELHGELARETIRQWTMARPPLRARARMVTSVAPPPMSADAKAMSCECW